MLTGWCMYSLVISRRQVAAAAVGRQRDSRAAHQDYCSAKWNRLTIELRTSVLSTPSRKFGCHRLRWLFNRRYINSRIHSGIQSFIHSFIHYSHSFTPFVRFVRSVGRSVNEYTAQSSLQFFAATISMTVADTATPSCTNNRCWVCCNNCCCNCFNDVPCLCLFYLSAMKASTDIYEICCFFV